MEQNQYNLKSDAEIKNHVERFFQRDSRINANDITVKVNEKNIILEGFVDDYNALKAAENDAYMVFGVKNVNNYLAVKTPESVKKPSDSEIESYIRSSMLWNSQIDSTDIEIIVIQSEVELQGTVFSYSERQLAEEISNSVTGVSQVINNLVVNTRHDVNDNLIADNVFEALDSDPLVNANDINISINNGLVTLTGNVQSYVAANAAHDALLYIPGVRGIANNIDIG